jgi:phosphatidylinositol alpha-1,6-mannosyltransferase
VTQVSHTRDLLFAYDFPPMGGGIARWMEALARGYPAGMLTVSTGETAGSAATDADLPQRIDRIPVHAERLRTVSGLLAWSRRGVALARDPTVRFAWCDTLRPAGYPARWAHHRTGLPYGIMVVGGDLLTLERKVARSAFKRRVMQSILGHAAVFVAISEWTADRCRTLLRALDLEPASTRVRVVPLGTDPQHWHFDPAGAATFRRRRGLPDGQWIVTVARLVEYKGIDTAIGIVADLVAEHPDLQYAVVGRGEHLAALRELSARLGVAGHVHFLTDVTDDELPAAYSIAQAYVGLTRETASDVEGFGLSFIEAAGCGLPVVATRSGGIPDAVQDGITGTLVDAHDVPAARDAVRRLLDDQALARQLGEAGRQRVERYFNWDRVVRDMQAIAAELGRETRDERT